MSVIVAVRDGRRTWIAADGRMTEGDTICADSVEKWISVRPDLWVGSSGCYGALGLIREHAQRLQEVAHDWAPQGERVRAFAVGKEIHKLLREDGWIDRAADGKPRYLDIEILIAQPGCVLQMHGTGSTLDVETFSAIGSGADFALGALEALAILGRNGTGADALLAVKAAVKRCSSCGGNIQLRSIEAAQQAPGGDYESAS